MSPSEWQLDAERERLARRAVDEALRLAIRERDELREALRVFGAHSERCGRVIGQYLEPPDYACTCGLSRLIDDG